MNSSIRLLLLLAATLGASSCTEGSTQSSGAPAGQAKKHTPRAVATRVEAARLHPTRAMMRLMRPGEVEGAREADLAAALGGFIERIRVEAGDRVRKGSVIARVDESMHVAQRDLTLVELQEAERELARLEKLGASIAKARVDTARTRVERARAQHRIAEIQVRRTTVRAPFGGTVADVHVEQGEVAPPGAPIVRMVKMDPAVVSVSVSDRDVGSLSVGGKAVITAAGSGRSLEGKLTRIEPTADLRTRSFMVKVEVPNRDEVLRPGMIAKVEFHQVAEREQLIMPQELLVTRLDGNGVFVVDEQSVARWRPLTLGQVIGDQIVVEAGLEGGEMVVVVGHRSLSDGDALILARQGECCTKGRVVFPVAQAAASQSASAEASP
ncbi:MAG: efflux RND transporter periplasmic adaptor subunit [Proteobacteria bacterium]|nr:efflux RND transporter periplasmic adaptor subunit [Pseudomonadota bacterium]